jgi:hypothetical protein
MTKKGPTKNPRDLLQQENTRTLSTNGPIPPQAAAALDLGIEIQGSPTDEQKGKKREFRPGMKEPGKKDKHALQDDLPGTEETLESHR